MSKKWRAYPGSQASFDRSVEKLRRDWDELHRGDREPFPDPTTVGKGLKASGARAGAREVEAALSSLIAAWGAFHRGDFEEAYRRGSELGPVGAVVAAKAEGIYAQYLETDETAKLRRFMAVAERCEQALAALPDAVNLHYLRAFALGRYGQGISIARALAEGLGGKVRESLSKTLAAVPNHAEAHSAMGLYHAEIIAKVGATIGGLTYGAKASAAREHLRRATELTPAAPIAWIEYGNGLLLLEGDKGLEEAEKAYRRAASIEPIDAMQALDAAYAREQLED